MAEVRRARRQSIASSGRASTVSIPSEPGEQYDALNTEKIAGSTTYEVRSTWFPAAASFIQSKPGGGLKGQWIGVRPLGQGSYGLAGLWEKRNEDGEVVDEIVVKQLLGGLNHKWNADVPKEVRIMKLMNKTHCRGVVRLRAYRRYCHQKVHRLYLRYCPHGDLRRLIDRYRRFRRHLPEAFLWEVFYYLVDAADAMANGPDKGPDDDDDDCWDFQIVHMDIKPDNIFLGYEDKDTGGVPYYPTAKLGDFGVSRECYLTDPENPECLMEAGTRGWQAPEQLQTFYDIRKAYRKPPFKVYGNTNIWAIGAVMYELMTLRRVDRIWLREGEDVHHGINPIMTLQKPEYSRSLKSAIRDCLRPYPEERPSPHELLEKIELYRRSMHKHLYEEEGEDSTEPTPGAGQRLYYQRNEINEMRPGKERLNPDEEEKEPGDADGRFRDPNLPPVKFPPFSDAALSKKKPKKNKDLGRNNNVRGNEEDTNGQAQSKVIWNRWHARENDGVDLRADTVGEEDEEERDLDDYSGDGEWSSIPSDLSNADSEELDQSPKGSQRRHKGGERLPDPATDFSSSSKGKRKASGNEEASSEGDDEEEDQSPIQNYRRHRERHELLRLQRPLSSSSKGKRKAPQNNQADIEQEEQDDRLARYPKRRRGLKKPPTPPAPPDASEVSSEDKTSGVGPEEGGQVEQEETEGEVENRDDGTYDDGAATDNNSNNNTIIINEDVDDDDNSTTTGPKRRPRRVISWGSQSYQPPGRRRKPRAPRKK